MATNETPWEKWQREKARRAAGEQPDNGPLNPVVLNNSSIYKKPGEYCPHPPDMLAVMKGYQVCLACGKTVAEGVLKSDEEREEEVDKEIQIQVGPKLDMDLSELKIDEEESEEENGNT